MKKFLLSLALVTIFTACGAEDQQANILEVPVAPEVKQEVIDGVVNAVTSMSDEEKEVQEAEDKKAFESRLEKDAKKAESGETVISVSYPKKAYTYNTADTRVVIWGDIANAENVEYVKVNGYKLQKYNAGSNEFNFIASTEFGTLERGNNEYVMQAFDAQGDVVAQAEYQIISDARFEALSNTGAEMWLIAFIFALVATYFCRKEVL